MDVTEHSGREFSLDTSVALLAGSGPWSAAAQRSTAWLRLLALMEILAYFTTIAALVWARRDSPTGAPLAAPLGAAALELLAMPAVLRLLGRAPWPRSLGANVVARVVLLTIAGLSVAVVLPGWRALWASALPVGLGVEAALTCEELGWAARPARWYVRFLRSGFHVGSLGALLATAIFGSDQQRSLALQLFGCAHIWFGASIATLWILNSLHAQMHTEQEQTVSDVVERERLSRAHWLHDDVCAQLRLVTLKLQTEATTKEEVIRLLDDFDHRLRIRQLDELSSSGGVRLAELLQPFIRNAQNLGVQITSVPGFEDAGVVLSEPTARLAARAASILTSNALNAGATEIAFDGLTQGDTLVISVADNGSGFTLGDIPHGRGLWTLIQDINPGGIDVSSRLGGGSVVTVTLPFTRGSRHGRTAAGR